MLIWNGMHWTHFVGSKLQAATVEERGVKRLALVNKPCVKNEPLGDHDKFVRAGEKFCPVLQQFLADPNASYSGNNAASWRMRLANAAGGVL